MRMSVDFPAPFGPSSPNIPTGIVSVTSSTARIPFGYVLERCSMRSAIVVIPSEARNLQSLIVLQLDDDDLDRPVEPVDVGVRLAFRIGGQPIRLALLPLVGAQRLAVGVDD